MWLIRSAKAEYEMLLMTPCSAGKASLLVAQQSTENATSI